MNMSAGSTPDSSHVGRVWLGKGTGILCPRRPQGRYGEGRGPDRGFAQPLGRERVEGRQLEHRRRVVSRRYVANASGLTGGSLTQLHAAFSNKILTSARNGELIMWDLNKTGSSKYGECFPDHTDSVRSLCALGIFQKDASATTLGRYTSFSTHQSCKVTA